MKKNIISFKKDKEISQSTFDRYHVDYNRFILGTTLSNLSKGDINSQVLERAIKNTIVENN